MPENFWAESSASTVQLSYTQFSTHSLKKIISTWYRFACVTELHIESNELQIHTFVQVGLY